MPKSRRMQKQAPPAPLGEQKIAALKKRKAGEPETKPEADLGKKKRKADDDDDKSSALKEAPKKKVNGIVNGDGKKGSGKESKKEAKGKPVEKKAKLMESDDEDEDEDEDEDMSGVDGEGTMDDEFGDLDGISEGSESQAEGGSGSDDDKSDEEDSVLASDEEEEESRPREALFSDDEDASDAEEKLTAANIEGLSRKLDAEKQAEQEEAEQDMRESAMQTNIAGDRPDIFPDGDSAVQPGLAPDLQLLRTRITDTIRVLGDLKTLAQPGKSRADYVDLLINDISIYYGYNRLMAEKLFNLFSPMEAFAFFEANETPRPVVIRTNTLRTNRRSLAQTLINRGVVLEPVGKWSKVGLQVFESAVPLGATPEYLAGQYILQAASSFLPVMALAPQPNERILDMAAAPGGKTTYVSALLRNTGCVIANDANKVRAKGLIGNIHRLGCKNTIVTNLDARAAFPKAMAGFDRVLLDAPCTGTGVISKDPSVKTSKNERDFMAIPHMQRELLVAAVDSVDHHSKTGGYVVYSTCSVTIEENEAVIQYILRKRPNVKIVDTGLGDFGSEGFTHFAGKQFDPKLKLARRYFPHRENVDGFFVCKLKKFAPTKETKQAPSTAATADGAASQPAASTKQPAKAAADDDNEEVVDKTPIADEDGTTMEIEGGAFGPFNEDEDAELIARAERNRIRRRGFDPRAVLNKPKGKSATQGEKGKDAGSRESEKPQDQPESGKQDEPRTEMTQPSQGHESKEKKQKKGNDNSKASTKSAENEAQSKPDKTDSTKKSNKKQGTPKKAQK